MTTAPDITDALRRAMKLEADRMTVTDSSIAARQLERSMERNRRTRWVTVGAAAAVAVIAVATGAFLLTGEDRDSGAPAPAKTGTPTLPEPGHRIMYSSIDKLLVVPDTGGKPVAVMDGDQPRFSPDGRQVAFRDGEGNLAVTEFGTWRPTVLARPSAADVEELGAPVWSPDASEIAYMEDSDLRIVDVATGRARLVRSFSEPFVLVMDWSPDGSFVLVGFDRSVEGGNMVVERLDLATKKLTPFLDGAGETMGVRFSPDGSQIAFYSDSRNCVCVAAADGSNVRTVLDFTDTDLAPDSARIAWSPDGSHLIWNERQGTGRVFLLDVASGDNKQLADGGEKSAQVDWDHPTGGQS